MLHSFLETFGLASPASCLLIFLGASLLMLWRLEAMMEHGLEGTALGTLVIPYCSGLGNLAFIAIVLRSGEPTHQIVVASFVNNITNLSLLLGLPALFWSLDLLPLTRRPKNDVRSGRLSRAAEKHRTAQRLSRLSLLLTLAAALFFTAAVWLLGRDGRLDATDGAALVGIFLFWQCFQVFDVLKHNVRHEITFGPAFYFDLILLLAGAWLVYASLDWLVNWLSNHEGGLFSSDYLGWLGGWLLVLPNALLALYYGWRRRADVVYSSQVGDGHICIPLCLGLAALVQPVALSSLHAAACALLAGLCALHLVLVLAAGRIPRWIGGALVAGYGWFVYVGLPG